jgi:microcystin-dependent protein
MSQPFVGEIRMFGGNFAPAGWMFCEGQLLPISEYDTLFNLIGTTYGGDGQETFALPDLRGRLPMHQGQSKAGGNITYQLAEQGGVETVTLTVQQIPVHNHGFVCSTSPAASKTPVNQVPALAQAATITTYGTDAPLVQLSPQSIGPAGGSQPHDNFQPYLCIDFIISLFGIFPTPS